MIDPATIVGGLTAIGSVAALVIKWQYDKRSKSGRIRDTEAEKLWDVQEQLRKAYQEYGESLKNELREAEAELDRVREHSDTLLSEANRIKAMNYQMVADLIEAKQELAACHTELLITQRKLKRALRRLNGHP